MAFTVSSIFQSDYGNHRVQSLRVTCDAATGSFIASSGAIIDVSYSPENIASAATMNLPVISPNKGVSGTSIIGTIAMTNCVSADIYRVRVTSGA